VIDRPPPMNLITSLTIFWLAVSALAHINGAFSWFFNKELADPTNKEWYTKACTIQHEFHEKKLNIFNFRCSLQICFFWCQIVFTVKLMHAM
jgi:hypothetical protein